MLGGVCGGLGQYLGVDPTLVRLFFVVLFFSGIGVLLYPALWIIVPREDRADLSAARTLGEGATEMAEQARVLGERIGAGTRGSNSLGGTLVGGFLVLLGVVFLAQNLHIWWLRWLSMDVVWPLLLIIGGIVLIQRRTRAA